MRCSLSFLAALVCVSVGGSLAFAQPTLVNLGTPPESNGVYSEPRAISDNGAFVAGYAGAPTRAFRWSLGQGFESIGLLPSPPKALLGFGYGISGDGKFVVGRSGTSSVFRAFRWSESGGLQDLGTLEFNGSARAEGTNSDGSVVVGSASTPGGDRAFRWTSSTAMQSLGTLAGDTFSFGNAVNADGSVVAGWSGTSFTDRQAFRWTADGGMIGLGTLPGGSSSAATGISNDGNRIVGNSRVGGNERAFRWVFGFGMWDIGVLPGATSSEARAISGDGNAVGGTSGNRAFIWTVDDGLRDLNEYLPTLGIDLTGWDLTITTAISDDGSVVTGWGQFEGQQRGWLVTGLPVAVGPSPTCPGDLNGDGVVDVQDLGILLNAFGNQCP